jgi:hypothetical protein
MEKLPSLYVLAGEYRALMDKLSDSEFDEQTIADTVESTGIVDDIQSKAQGIEMVARNFMQTDEMLNQEIARLIALKKRRAMAATRLREYLQAEMEHMGIKRIECPLFTIALRNAPASVDVFDARQLPLDYWRTPPAPEPQPDKVLIAKALKVGKEVPGARLDQSKHWLAIS